MRGARPDRAERGSGAGGSASGSGAGRAGKASVSRALALAAAWAAAVLGATCGGDASEGRFSGPPQVGDEAPAFAAPSLATGDTVSLASLRGRPVVVNLWATWCPPCRHETPYLQSLYERYQDDGLRIVGITVDGRSAADDARAFLDEMGVTYTQLHDPAMRSLDVFRVIGLPATYVIDAEGIVRFAANRPVFEGDEPFESAIEAALEPGS